MFLLRRLWIHSWASYRTRSLETKDVVRGLCKGGPPASEYVKMVDLVLKGWWSTWWNICAGVGLYAFCSSVSPVLGHHWLDVRKGIGPVESSVLVCWSGRWRFDWSFARLIAPVVTTTTTTYSSSAPMRSSMETFWYRLKTYQGWRGKWPLNECRVALLMGVDPGSWGLDPWKYVGGVRVCFDSLKCHILSFKTVVG